MGVFGIFLTIPVNFPEISGRLSNGPETKNDIVTSENKIPIIDLMKIDSTIMLD